MTDPASGSFAGSDTLGRYVYTSKSDMVTALLRELILSGELKASEALQQRVIAARFGVSQTPVREALRRLESEGLVTSDPHRGAIVAESRIGATAENFQIRAVLESLGAKLAAKSIDKQQLQRLEELNASMQAVGDDDAEYARLNREFHFTIYRAAGTPLLLSLMRLLWRSIGDAPMVARSHVDSTRQHDRLVAALRARDSAAAAEATTEHILGSAPIEKKGQDVPR